MRREFSLDLVFIGGLHSSRTVGLFREMPSRRESLEKRK